MEALYWMFKQVEFKKHSKYLFAVYLIFIAVSIVLFFIGELFKDNVIVQLLLYSALMIAFVCPIFCLLGYFWELTGNIIDRDVDILSSQVYDHKIKEINKIELPEIKTGKFIWRGIASIVANLMLLFPIMLLFSLSSINEILEFYSVNTNYSLLVFLIFFVSIGFFIPALLWNYARRNSVFAVWNIHKAIYIMGNYLGRYLKNTFLFLLLTLANFFVTSFLTSILGLANVDIVQTHDFLTIFKVGTLMLINYATSIYWLYVNAYLLGTIAPPCEF